MALEVLIEELAERHLGLGDPAAVRRIVSISNLGIQLGRSVSGLVYADFPEAGDEDLFGPPVNPSVQQVRLSAGFGDRER